MYVAKTSRRKGFHKLAMPKPKSVSKMIPKPKFPKMPKLKSKY